MDTVLLDLSVLATDSRFRGIGRYALMLARGLAARPDGVRPLALEQVRPFRSGIVTDDLLATADRLTRANAPVITHTAWAWSIRVGLMPATRAVRPALVHSVHPEATPLGPLGCPRVTTLHDLVPMLLPEHYGKSWKEGYAVGRRKLDHRRYHRADHLLAVSECSARDATQHLGVPADRISVVYPGIDLTNWSPEPASNDVALRARLGAGDRPYALYVGAADWRKNAEGMLGALALARQKPGARDLVLVWAGRLSTGDDEIIQELIAHHQLQNAVRLVGFVDQAELRALYRGAVAQLFVSRYEGFGFPIVEAMAMGCPVVTSKGSSTGEVAGDAALLVDPEDHPAIADALSCLARDEGERTRWRARGFIRARRFTLERMAQDATEVYRSVIARHRHR